MDEQMSIFDYGVTETEQKQDDYPCPSCDVAFGSLECFRRRGYFWDKHDRKWLRDRYGNLLRSGKRDCNYEHKDEEDEEEHYARTVSMLTSGVTFTLWIKANGHIGMYAH